MDKTMRTTRWIAYTALALALAGCGSGEVATKAPEADKATEPASSTTAPPETRPDQPEPGQATPIPELSTPLAEDTKPAGFSVKGAFTAAQIAGVYSAVIPDEEVKQAKDQGTDLTEIWPVLTLGKDKTWIMGTAGGKSGDARGRYEIKGSQLLLTPEVFDGKRMTAEQMQQMTQVFDVLEGGKAVQSPDIGGKRMVFRKK